MADKTVELALGLLSQPAVLAHPTAASHLVEAILQLTSTLQHAELQAVSEPAESPAALLLQQLQAATAPPQPPGDPLKALVQRIGFRPADLQRAQAQLALRTAGAMQRGFPAGSYLLPAVGSLSSGSGSNLSAAADGAGGAALLSPPALSAADQLLDLALSLPPYLPGAGGLGSLAEVVAVELLPLMSQFPLAQQQLSDRGWAAYLVLEPRALQQCLAEILQARCATSSPASMASLLSQQPHWEAAATAVATHPSLHLVARQTLHTWLAESGNPAVWELLVALRQRAAGAAAAVEKAEQRRQTGGTQPLEYKEPGMPLPLPLRLLYPAGLARDLATLLHAMDPCASGLAEAVGMIQRLANLPAAVPAACAGGDGVSAAAAAAAAPSMPLAAQHPAGQRVWEALLDHPRWLCSALQLLPLAQLAAGKEVQVGRGTAAEGPRAAAVYVSWLMWPHDRRRREALQLALSGRLGVVDLCAVRPWLQTLQGWQRLWQGLI